MNFKSLGLSICLVVGSTIWSSNSSAAPPIEALQRSVQQRWPVVNSGAHCVFPRATSDVSGNPVPAYPPNGYYGADLDNPGTLNSLVQDLENKVFLNLVNSYYLLDSVEGTQLAFGTNSSYTHDHFQIELLASYRVSTKVPSAL